MNEHLKEYIRSARWFGGKGRDFDVTDTRRLTLPSPGDAETTAPLGLVTIELVHLQYADGATDLYQLPVSYYLGPRKTLPHALIGHWEDEQLGPVWAYDAVHDHAATSVFLKAFCEGTAVGALTFHRVGEPEIDRQARSTVLTGEQSNTSVKFGDDSLMKVFRRVTAGQNPDIEILAALTEAGNEHVATLHGWVETTVDGELLQLGILQQFLRTASDGWELALASLRDLYAEETVSAQEAGGDFAGEAHRLGVAVAEMHESLGSCFPTEEWDRSHLRELADAMSRRLEEAVAVVPSLAESAPGLHSLFDAVRHVSGPVTAQRIHGDLHLGQTLRTVRNWKIIDFEGEPAKSLEERRRPDSPWRDVAGMLRSFDYAAEMSRLDQEQVAGDNADRIAQRGREWSDRNVTAFLTGYREASPAQFDDTLLVAYAADKAVYEAVYEARNRPGWLPIPLTALTRLASRA